VWLAGENDAMPRPRRPHPQDPHALCRRHRLLAFIIGGVSARTPTVAATMPIARFLLPICVTSSRILSVVYVEDALSPVMRSLLTPAQPDEELLQATYFALYRQGPRQMHQFTLCPLIWIGCPAIWRLLSE